MLDTNSTTLTIYQFYDLIWERCNHLGLLHKQLQDTLLFLQMKILSKTQLSLLLWASHPSVLPISNLIRENLISRAAHA